MRGKTTRAYKLKELKIELTYRCNLNCIHCSSEASPSNTLEMTEQDCLRIIREAAKMGMTELTLSGGEPLIWPGLYSAVTAAAQEGLQIAIYTSGNVSGIRRALKRLKECGARKCVFSVFAGSRRLHERVTRVAGSFEKTIDAVGIANRLGLETEFHFVPWSINYHELPAIASLTNELGVPKMSILRFVPQGRGYLLRTQALSRAQNLELKRAIERLRADGFNIRTGSPYNFLMLNEQPRCLAGIDRLIVAPDMRIYPCDAFKQIRAEEVVGSAQLSSLQDASLADCWTGSPYLRAVRRHLARPLEEPCSTCEARDKCESGCLAQKVIHYRAIEKRPDPDCLLE